MRLNSMSRRLRNRRPSLLWAAIEPLEERQMLAATVTTQLPPILADTTAPAANSIDLENFVNDPNIPGTVAEMEFLEGSQTATVDVALTDSTTPITVQNFLSYANSGAYNGTILHRNAVLSTGANGSPSTPAEIVQGGGFFLNESNPSGAAIDAIPTNAPITNEWNANETNVAGSIAMARTSDPNSATSQWFFDVVNNPSLDDVADSNEYAVFGHVIGNGLGIIQSLAALPTFQLDIPTGSGSASPVPVTGITETQAQDPNTAIRPQNLIYLEKVTTTPGMTYTVTSLNPSLVKPTITGSTLSFTYGSGSGVAQIDIVGTSFDGSSIANSFEVTVPNTAEPGQGPVANNDTPPNVLTGTFTTLNPLTNDTDSLAALTPGGVQILSGPFNGTATVDPTFGVIDYTSNAGYIGPDSLTYDVQDANGATSAPATITLNVVALPAHVTVGGGLSLNYTEPDGTVAHVSVNGGTALIDFATFDVQTTTSHGVITASGPGATISSITITNSSAKSAASLQFSAHGGTDGFATVNSITDTGSVTSIIAPNVHLTGTINANNLATIDLGSADNSTLSLTSLRPINLSIPTVTNTSINMNGGQIGTIRSTSWSDTDGGIYTISAAFILSLLNTGDFNENLNLSNTGLGISSAKIGGQISGGAWQISGEVGSLTAGSAASAWSMTTDNLVNKMHFGGNLSSNISTGAIGSLSITGNLSNAIIETRANVKKGFVQFKQLSVGGGISNSMIIASGNIGSITAASLTSSQINAGLDSTDISNDQLPTAASDLTAGATISSIRLGSANPAFTDSKISAAVIGSLKLGIVNTSNGGSAEGIAAPAAKISSIVATLSSGGSLVLGKAQLKDAATLTTYLNSKNITLADFQIDLLT
jgi:cyclophilin family peptidyl-prolyl cis-trans isomerase